MSELIPKEKEKLIEELYDEKHPLDYISETTKIPIEIVYSYVKFYEKIKEMGFSSVKEYIAREKPQSKLNVKLSNFIKNKLIELDKTQEWLAQELDVSEKTISRYVRGQSIPEKELQGKLFRILKSNYKTLDDLMKD